MTIKQKQNLLAYLGYYVGNIDGEWGTLSKTATTAFQKDFGLKADGTTLTVNYDSYDQDVMSSWSAIKTPN